MVPISDIQLLTNNIKSLVNRMIIFLSNKIILRFINTIIVLKGSSEIVSLIIFNTYKI